MGSRRSRFDRNTIRGSDRHYAAKASAKSIRAYLGITDVLRTILFGSFARGEADAVGDVDLVLVEATDAPFTQCGLRHLALFRMRFAPGGRMQSCALSPVPLRCMVACFMNGPG